MQEIDLTRSLLALLEIRGVGPGAIKKNYARILASRSEAEVRDAMRPLFGEVDESEWRAALSKGEQYLQRCAEVGVLAVAFGDSRYPSSLMELSTPPPVLFCRGEVNLLARPILGVIGTRKATPFGETVAERAGRYFSDRKVHLCNGLADGIDICAVTYDGAFLPGVVGVMACGLDILESNVTSKRIAQRAQKLLEAGGLLVSEFPPGAVEDQNSVVASCRLQAGLSQALLLVQSSSEGGSRFTAGHFAKLPRKLAFVVPPESRASETAFSANQMLLKGRDGLAEFVGLKTCTTLKADLLPMRSKDDYDRILHALRNDASTLI
jgi:DNA processing protein